MNKQVDRYKKSKCCDWPVRLRRVVSEHEHPAYYECSHCMKPCDVVFDRRGLSRED